MCTSSADARVEAALIGRVDRLLLVVEAVTDNKNALACLRVADVLGIQRVWLVQQPNHHLKQQQKQPPLQSLLPSAHTEAAAHDARQQDNQHDAAAMLASAGRKKGRIARAASQWLDVDVFPDSAVALAALRRGGWAIWATDLGPGTVPLGGSELAQSQLPDRLAVVVGSEAAGVSQLLLDAADRCVHTLANRGVLRCLSISITVPWHILHLASIMPLQAA